MDLNAQPPAVWTLEEGPYEIAQECRMRKSNVLVLLNAWLDSEEDVEDTSADWRTINFWAARLRPLWEEEEREAEVLGDNEEQKETQDHRTTVIICNRTGSENGNVLSTLAVLGI
jgi:protein N-terminal amidase